MLSVEELPFSSFFLKPAGTGGGFQLVFGRPAGEAVSLQPQGFLEDFQMRNLKCGVWEGLSPVN